MSTEFDVRDFVGELPAKERTKLASAPVGCTRCGTALIMAQGIQLRNEVYRPDILFGHCSECELYYPMEPMNKEEKCQTKPHTE